MSIIAAGTTTTTALSSTGNTDGTLQLQVNGTTPSVTLNALGAVGVGASPNFGTSGQVLISGGSTAAPTWGTAGSATSATTATNIAGGGAGQVPYNTGSGTTAFVAAADADPTAKSTIMDNLEAYINDLANATDQATMDAAIQNYLTFYSRFHNYSFTNSMLIFMQKRDATKVAGYNTWKKQNRGVKKGAKAIWIWFPMTINAKQETDTAGVDFGAVDQAAKSRSFTKFSLGKVYDISDTYELNEKGKVPEQPKWSAENTPSETADELVDRKSVV
jgi:hypothetical protein